MCTYSFQKMVANCNEVDCVRVAICSTLVCCQLKKHLSSVLVSNGYPSSFVVKLAKTPRVTANIANIEPALGFKSIAVLPYIKDVSKVLRGFLQHQGIRTILKSYITLRSHLVQPKYALEPTKQNGVVYKIPCECSKVYMGETGRSMRKRIKEHDRNIRFVCTQSCVASEHAYETGHIPIWSDAKFIDNDPH